jgi:hypothetical protein
MCCSYEETEALVEEMILVFININITFIINNEQADSSGRGSNCYSGGIRFKYRSGYRISCIVFVLFSSTSRGIPWEYF